jgi:hypothetical protein
MSAGISSITPLLDILQTSHMTIGVLGIRPWSDVL